MQVSLSALPLFSRVPNYKTGKFGLPAFSTKYFSAPQSVSVIVFFFFSLSFFPQDSRFHFRIFFPMELVFSTCSYMDASTFLFCVIFLSSRRAIFYLKLYLKRLKKKTRQAVETLLVQDTFKRIFQSVPREISLIFPSLLFARISPKSSKISLPS